MSTSNIDFETIFDLHWRWRKGIFLKEIISEKTVDIYKGIPKDFTNNFAIPTRDDGYINFHEVAKHLDPKTRWPITLLEKHQNTNFFRVLSEFDYEAYQSLTWLVYDLKETFHQRRELNLSPNILFKKVDPIIDSDFRALFTENPTESDMDYLNIFDQLNKGTLKNSEFPDLKNDSYVEYIDNIPAAVGCHLYSLKENFSCLNCIAFTERWKRVSYPTLAMISYLVDQAKKLNITRVYTLAMYGYPKWKEFMAYEFSQIQREEMFRLREGATGFKVFLEE